MTKGWQAIETAPSSGEFLVRGGEMYSDLEGPIPYLCALVEQGGDRFEVCNSCYYSVWVVDPTEWHPLPE